MRPHAPRDGRPRRPSRSCPVLEGLETRELLSAAASSTTPHGARSATSAYLALVQKERAAATGQSAASVDQAHTDSPNGLQGTLSAGPFLDPTVIRRAANALYSNSPTPGTPTQREIHRETFTSRFVGLYTIGAPRFSDRASTIHLYGTDGGSNQFFRGKFQIALFPPADPGATPTPGNPYANQITGVADFFAQNYLQSGSSLVLDLNGTPAPGSNPRALPTDLTWTYDSNTSAGPYAAPVGILPGSGFTQGAGTVEIHWIPDPHPLPGTQGSGSVIITFQGLINTSQIVSAVSKFIS
jgi:hypothetical protein